MTPPTCSVDTPRLQTHVVAPHILPANSRIDAVPAPVVVHIIAAAVYALLGALQFSAIRRRDLVAHRAWMIRRASNRRVRRARTHAVLVGSR